MFVTFEGVEGSGKSTQARALDRHLRSLGLPTLLTREPGGTELGERLRRLLLEATEVTIGATAETLLFAAARAQLVAEVIGPGLRAGKVVICDRFADSTIAYQVYGRGLDADSVGEVVRFATGGLLPDLTVLLDLSAADGLERKGAHGTDRFEIEALEFHRRVRDGYLELARRSPERWWVVDGSQRSEVIAAAIGGRVESLLSQEPRSRGGR